MEHTGSSQKQLNVRGIVAKYFHISQINCQPVIELVDIRTTCMQLLQKMDRLELHCLKTWWRRSWHLRASKAIPKLGLGTQRRISRVRNFLLLRACHPACCLVGDSRSAKENIA